jgi:hypothetical protein
VRSRIPLGLGLAGLVAVSARAERTEGFFAPPGSFTVEISLDNAPYLRLPLGRNAVTSLEVVGAYAIGGTSAKAGLSPFLFAVSLPERKLVSVLDLEAVVPGQRSILSGFGRDQRGTLLAATMPQKEGESGHLIRVTISEAGLRATDLGIPVPKEGIFALATDARRGMVYGISHPSGKFFSLGLAGGATRVYGSTSPSEAARTSYFQFALEPADYLSRRLLVDGEGRVYGSQPVNRIFRFDPRTEEVELLPDELPAVWDRRVLGRVDSWAVSPDGAIYGGNAGDGQLFRLDPVRGRIVNLGKPVMMPRLKGLAFGRDGRLYGVAGGAPGYAHLFRYDPRDGFVDLGSPRFEMVGEDLPPGILWRGFQISTLAASEDGRLIIMGDDEVLSQLMVFPVE